MRTTMIWCAALALLVSIAATADAATLRVGPRKPYATIGEAVAAASSGDTIVVFRGRYTEDVEVATPGLKLKARRGVRWLPAAWKGDCLTLRAAAEGATVSGFTFSTTGQGVTVEAEDVTILRCRFRGGTGIRGIGSNSLLVSRCDIRWGARGVYVQGDGVTLDRLRISQHDSGPVEIIGNDATITRVTQNGSENDPGFDVLGDRTTIERCSARATWNHGIFLRGDDCTARNNRVADVNNDAGIEVLGDGASVENNTVADCVRYTGIEVVGGTFTVRGNRITDVADGRPGLRVDNGMGATGTATLASNTVSSCGRDGIEIAGQDVVVTGNRVVDCVGTGFDVTGLGHQLERNVVVGAGENGFRVSADETELVRCEARDCEVDGFFIAKDAENVVLEDCRATDCAEGLHNDESVTFSGCTFLRNFQDVSNDGSMTEGTGNTYDTGGPISPPIH